MAQHEDQFWIFGYGSLIWKPGFDFVDRQVATLYGFHRSFCVWSVHWRGTHAHPGLVLGLDHGGSAKGVAYRVPAQDWPQIRHYLRAREQVTMIYRETYPLLHLADGSKVRALAFPVDRHHRQYAGAMDERAQADVIGRASGLGGPNREYLFDTIAALQQEGVRDRGLERVASALAKAENS